MAIFKRIEVWILLAVSLAAVWFVLRMDADTEAGGPPSTGQAAAPVTRETDGPPPATQPPVSVGRFRIRKVRATVENGHEIIEIELAGINESDQALDLNQGKARLFDVDGSEIPPFFVPFAAPPVLSPGEESTVTLRYWQTRTGDGARSALTLEIEGESLQLAWQDGQYRPLNRAETSP